MGSRREGREAALQMLYQMDLSGVGAEDAVRLYWTHLAESQEGQDLADRIVRGYGADPERVDGVIRAVSHHWRLERMSRVDRNILRCAAWELFELPDVPRRVTLNEAVELAKRFGSEGSPGFVNGVLDRIATEAGKR